VRLRLHRHEGAVEAYRAALRTAALREQASAASGGGLFGGGGATGSSAAAIAAASAAAAAASATGSVRGAARGAAGAYPAARTNLGYALRELARYGASLRWRCVAWRRRHQTPLPLKHHRSLSVAVCSTRIGVDQRGRSVARGAARCCAAM